MTAGRAARPTAPRWSRGATSSKVPRWRACARRPGHSRHPSSSLPGSPSSRGCGDYLTLLTAIFGQGGEISYSGASPDSYGGAPRALFAPDGRALVTWAGGERRDGVWWGAPHAALLGAAPEHSALGAELRDVASLTPLLLDGGSARRGLDRQ